MQSNLEVIYFVATQVVCDVLQAARTFMGRLQHVHHFLVTIQDCVLWVAVEYEKRFILFFLVVMRTFNLLDVWTWGEIFSRIFRAGEEFECSCWFLAACWPFAANFLCLTERLQR